MSNIRDTEVQAGTDLALKPLCVDFHVKTTQASSMMFPMSSRKFTLHSWNKPLGICLQLVFYDWGK